MVLSDVYFGEGWACWSFIASQRFIVEMEMETYFFSWLIDLYGLNILAYCILSWFCYHASHNGSGKWVIPPIWVSFHFFGDFPLNHDFGRKGSTVVLTLISNAFFSRLFHHPPQSFRETRFAKFKAYSMLIFHHFIGPRTKNPTNKRSHIFFSPTSCPNTKKTPMTPGKLANLNRGLSGAIISWRLLPTKSFFNGKGDPSAAGNDWIYWSRRGALGSLGRTWGFFKNKMT